MLVIGREQAMSYKATEGIMKRMVGTEECPWLENNLNTGDMVYRFPGCTYGCISPDGIAVTLSSEGKTPFFEIPENSVIWAAEKAGA
jgi:hypothetical protein